jgi:DNA repair protein RecO (recombination protein O)
VVATVIDQAICIRQWDWSETSQTVSLFARDTGIVRGIAKGSRREKSPFSGGLEVLTRGEMVAIVKPGSDLANITAWDLQEIFPPLRRSLSVFYTGMYLADLTHHAVSDRDPHPALFDALLSSLRALAPGADRAAALRYQWAMLVETGYRPEVDRDVVSGSALEPARTYAFAPHQGGFTRDAGPGANGPLWRVRSETLDLLRRLALDGATDIASTPPEAIDRSSRLLDAYIREVLGRAIPAAAALFGEPAP